MRSNGRFQIKSGLPKQILVTLLALGFAACGESDSNSVTNSILFKGSCYYGGTGSSDASKCSEFYSTSPVSQFQTNCEDGGNLFTTESCSIKNGSFGSCKITLGEDGEYEKTWWYSSGAIYDELSEQLAACSNSLNTYGTPQWIAKDGWAPTAGFGDAFVGTDGNTPTSAKYTVSGDGCVYSDNRLLCKSSGGSSGKAGEVNGSTASKQRISADLTISGGDYNGVGSSAVLVLWANSSDLNSASSRYECGINEGKVIIRSSAGIQATGSGTNVATDGKTFYISFSIEGTSATCTITGSINETLTHTLSAAPTGTGYPGLFAGWYDSGSERNYAYWDNLLFEAK